MKVSKAGVLSQGGAGGAMHPQILADQLTLSQPVGADYAHKIILATPNFQTFLRPWTVKEKLRNASLSKFAWKIRAACSPVKKFQILRDELAWLEVCSWLKNPETSIIF